MVIMLEDDDNVIIINQDYEGTEEAPAHIFNGHLRITILMILGQFWEKVVH